METFWEIALQTVEFLTLIFGILGMTISLMLLFSPHLARSLSNILNRQVNVDNHIEYLDKNIEITEFFYRYHAATGILIVAGSAFSLFFFFFSLDVTKFADILFESQANAYSGELIISLVTWVGKIGCLTGLVFGILLLFAPDFMKRIEDKLNSWLATKPMIEKLDKSSHDLEPFFFRLQLA
jgi:hypothetical protein